MNKYYSQNGQDKILEGIFKKLKIKKGWFVDVGAWDGQYLSNTFIFLEKGWKGIEIEGNKFRFQCLLKKTAKRFPRQVLPSNTYVKPKGKNRLDSLLEKTPLPKDFDLLSIDIDSWDYWVWKSLKNYSPKVVCIEIRGWEDGEEYIQPFNMEYKKKKRNGSSFLSMLYLGQKKNYNLVAFPGNMIFIRKELYELL